MEWEKIVYFYPMREQQNQMKNPPAARRRWFQNAELDLRELEFNVIGCAVPPFYYKRRPWKPQDLSDAMECVLRRVEGMTDTCIHPQVGMLLTEEYTQRWLPRRETVQMATARLIGLYTAEMLRARGEAAVLLGAPADTDWQMKMTEELLQPYLPRINRLLIFYEEIPETDVWTELGSYLDEYYYEYGLVPQLEPYVRTHAGADAAVSTDGSSLRCGRPRCGGMILDYCGQFRYPKIPPDGRAVYIDVTSAGEKERLLGRKNPRIPYISPLKYLDTMVKNSYD